MKRSEMLNHIETVIDIYYGKRNNHDVLSEQILKEIEFLGMLPPERTYIKALKNGSIIKIPHNSWEPENE